jgi:hypothetical protein
MIDQGNGFGLVLESAQCVIAGQNSRTDQLADFRSGGMGGRASAQRIAQGVALG